MTVIAYVRDRIVVDQITNCMTRPVEPFDA